MATTSNMVSQTGRPTAGNEPVVMSSPFEIATDGDDRQANALQSVTLTVNPVNISPGDSTANTFGVSPNTSPTEITQPLIATEGATDPESTGLVIEPTVLFYVGYSGISEREQSRNIRTCSCEISLAAICDRQRDGALLRFRSNWKISLIDALIGAVAKNLPPGVVNPKLRSFELACDKLRSDKSILSRLRFSKYHGDWLTALELQPCTMHVAVDVNLSGFNALLQADSIIPFVAADGAFPDREEVLGNGTLQTAVQQQKAAFADVMQVTGPARPNPVSEISVATFKAYQVETDNGSDDSYYEFIRRVGIYALSPDFR